MLDLSKTAHTFMPGGGQEGLLAVGIRANGKSWATLSLSVRGDQRRKPMWLSFDGPDPLSELKAAIEKAEQELVKLRQAHETLKSS